MKKSLYSLMLMDEVVERIDRLARLSGTNRSNLINQILAEHVSCITPQKRCQNFFGYFENNIKDPFIIQNQSSDTIFLTGTVLKYKYKPSVRYSVALYNNLSGYAGELKVYLRTQNKTLIELLDIFFKFWCKLEAAYMVYDDNKIYQIKSGKFTRLLSSADCPDEETFCKAVVGYIEFLDNIIQYYFSNIENNNLLCNIENMYKKYISENNKI